MRHNMTWEQVVKQLSTMGWRQDLKLCKNCMPHPTTVKGMNRHGGSPMGQQADYRLVLNGESGLHIREYEGHWTAHLDEVDPQVDFIEHLRQDAPGYHALLNGASAALIGKLFGASDVRIKQVFWAFAGLSLVSSQQARRDDKMRLARLRASY